MSLTLHQRARIDAYFVSKSRKARQERYRRQWLLIVATAAIVFVCGAILLVAMSGIEIGHQSDIFEAYRSRPHAAISVEGDTAGLSETEGKGQTVAINP